MELNIAIFPIVLTISFRNYLTWEIFMIKCRDWRNRMCLPCTWMQQLWQIWNCSVMSRNDAFSFRAPKTSLGSKHMEFTQINSAHLLMFSLSCFLLIWFCCGLPWEFEHLQIVAFRIYPSDGEGMIIFLFSYVQVLTEAVRVSQQVHFIFIFTPSRPMYLVSFFFLWARVRVCILLYSWEVFAHL